MRVPLPLMLWVALIFSSTFSEAATPQATALSISRDEVGVDRLDLIPGRRALKLALLTMERSELTQAQRLQIAEPLFQQAIGAAEEIEINDVNDKLRDLARLAAQSSTEEKEQLGPRAVELLETIKQPLQARLLFAVVLQNAAAESNDQQLNQRAIKWLQTIESKDPGAKMDVAVQGCLSICRKQPICTISEAEALTLGQMEVEKNQAAKKREAGQVDWQRIAGSLGELFLGMIFCWGVGFLVKMVVNKFRQERIHVP